MPLIEFVGQSGRDADNVAANPSRLVNVYAERTTDGVRWLKSVLAMNEIVTLGGVFITAMANVDGKLYVVCGGQLYTVAVDGTPRALGAVDHGPASISGNNGKVAVQAGARYFVYDPAANTLTEPTAGAFAAVGACEYFENYTVLTELGGRKFAWSSLAVPGTLPGLNFTTADGRDDNVLRPFALHGQLYIFKERSHEIWYNAGGAGARALERVSGGVRDVGLKSRDLVCRFVGGAFMVGSDNRAHLVAPGRLQPVSTPPVETAIKQNQAACCVSYEDEGHTMVAVVFRDAPAWVYDVATGEWHERAYGADLGAWPASASAMLGGDWAIGGNSGQIAVLRRSNMEDSVPLVREAVSRSLYLDGTRATLREFELFPRQGLTPAQIMLSLSRDGGMTWTGWKPRPTGDLGQFGRRVIWRRLGQARTITAKIRWTEPAEITLSAQARITT